jgi:hypothetical protein
VAAAGIALSHAGSPKPRSNLSLLFPIRLPMVFIEEDTQCGQHVFRREKIVIKHAKVFCQVVYSLAERTGEF